MKIVSNTDESLHRAYLAEALPIPAVISWPMTGAGEADRQRREDFFRRNLAAAPPSGLNWISSHAESKYDPGRILDGARSVLVSWLPYFRQDPPDDPSENPGRQGRVARYARGRDYHKELGGRLKRIARELGRRHPDHQFRAFTDIGPLDETWLAVASGLGFKGRHTLAILPKAGSWVVLGHIVTTLEVSGSPDRPSPLACPDGCRRCIDACPTDALSPPGVLHAEACLSYQTIEHSGPGGPDYLDSTDDWIFGCDVCQEVCPFNARVVPTDIESFLTDRAGAGVDLKEILMMTTHEEVTARFAGSPLMRAGRNGLVRNAATAAGNSGESGLIPLLEKLVDDEDEGVRRHSRWAIDRLESIGRKEDFVER